MCYECIMYKHCMNIDDTYLTILAADRSTIISLRMRASYLVKELDKWPRRAAAHHAGGQVGVPHPAGQHPRAPDVDVGEVHVVDEFLRKKCFV